MQHSRTQATQGCCTCLSAANVSVLPTLGRTFQQVSWKTLAAEENSTVSDTDKMGQNFFSAAKFYV
jgi:hypothetical protein